MCLIKNEHYVCGHSYDTEIRPCLKYKKKTETGPFLRKLFSRTHSTCGRNIRLQEDVHTACSPLCAKILQEKWKKHDKDLKKQEKQLKKREQERLERARAIAREYRKNKQKEEEALQRQKEEREQKQRNEREKERKGKSKQAISKKDIRPLWQTARGGTDVRATRPSQAEVKQPLPPSRTEPQRAPPRGLQVLPEVYQLLPSPRTEAQRAPPRLADRQVLPQAYQPLPPTRTEAQRAPPRLADRQVLPQAHRPQNNPQPPRTQANFDPQGHRPQVAHTQPSMPFASGTNRAGSSITRRNHQRVGRHQEGTLEDPRVRIQAQQASNRNALAQRQAQRPPAQTVASHRPVKVSSPPGGFPQASRGRFSPGRTATSPGRSRPQYQPRPPASNQEGYRPPVPPKDPWRPQHPNLAPAPLSLRQRAPDSRTVRPPAQQPGGGTTTFNGYRPDPTRTVPNRKPVPVSNNTPPRTQGPSQPGGYRPNPMFANRQDKKPAAAEGSPKPEKKKGKWLKKLLGQPSSETVNSVEWVSADAARIERGE